MIKTSLNKKLVVIFSLILIAVIVLNVVINSWLLPNVYKDNKLDKMTRLYNDISKEYSMSENTDAVVEIVKDALSKENLRVFIWDENDRLIIDSLPLSYDKGEKGEAREETFPKNEKHFKNDRKGFARDFFMGRHELYVFYTEPPVENVVRKGTDYSIFSFVSYDDVQEEDLYLKGTLSNDYKLLIQTPFASIDEAVSLSNKLLLHVGIVMLIVGIVVVAITSKNIVKPIKELSMIAKSMEGLDFTKKYVHHRNDEIGQLGDSVNSLSEKLEITIHELYNKNDALEKDNELKSRIDSMRKEFIANASHELKTPIALIGGYAEGLRDNIANDEESRKLYTNVIIEETSKMENIIKQLLDMMELDSAETVSDATVFSLSDVAEDVINNLKLIADAKGITINFTSNGCCNVLGDYWRIYEAVSNYLSNAVNHAKNENIINVIVCEEAECVRLSVFNTGDKIPDGELCNIWERFYKIDKAHTREYGGTGLGLSIVRSVIKLHDGDCGVVNHQNGVEFYFTLKKEKSNEV